MGRQGWVVEVQELHAARLGRRALQRLGWRMNREWGYESKAVASYRTPNGLVDGFGFALHVVHEEILAEVVGRGEVGFAFAHLGDFLHELNEAVIGGEHEGVDHDAGAFAFVYFFESFADHEGIEAEGVFVNAAVFQSERGRLAVCDHDDLPHVFALAKKNALGHAQAFAGIGVIRADLNAGELADGNFFGGVVEQN